MHFSLFEALRWVARSCGDVKWFTPGHELSNASAAKMKACALTCTMSLFGTPVRRDFHKLDMLTLEDVSSSLKEALVCWEKCRQFRKIALVQWLLACKSVIRLCTWGYGETINI